MLSFYELQLVLFVSACVLWLLVDHLIAKRSAHGAADDHALRGSSAARARLTRQYLLVYGIVMGAHRSCAHPR